MSNTQSQSNEHKQSTTTNTNDQEKTMTQTTEPQTTSEYNDQMRERWSNGGIAEYIERLTQRSFIDREPGSVTEDEFAKQHTAVEILVMQYEGLGLAVAYAAERLNAAAENIADKMARVQRYVAEMKHDYCSVNSLGELQGSGSDLDRLCGELHKAIENRNSFERMCARLNIDLTDHDFSSVA